MLVSYVSYCSNLILKNSFHFELFQIKFSAVGSRVPLLEELIITDLFKYRKTRVGSLNNLWSLLSYCKATIFQRI